LLQIVLLLLEGVELLGGVLEVLEELLGLVVEVVDALADNVANKVGKVVALARGKSLEMASSCCLKSSASSCLSWPFFVLVVDIVLVGLELVELLVVPL